MASTQKLKTPIRRGSDNDQCFPGAMTWGVVLAMIYMSSCVAGWCGSGHDESPSCKVAWCGLDHVFLGVCCCHDYDTCLPGCQGELVLTTIYVCSFRQEDTLRTLIVNEL